MRGTHRSVRGILEASKIPFSESLFARLSGKNYGNAMRIYDRKGYAVGPSSHHSTRPPFTRPSRCFCTTNLGDVSADTSMTSQLRPQPAIFIGDDAHEKKMQLLDTAAAEGRRIFDRARTRQPQQAQQQRPNDTDIQVLTEAADGLLAVTKMALPLAQIITHNRNDERVVSLHRAFLSIIQKCLTAYASTLPSDGELADPSELLSSILLDKILRLSVRARDDLDLAFHLPLYRAIATGVAQSPSHNHLRRGTVEWILQTGRWARGDFGAAQLSSSNEEFFAHPLLLLARQRRLVDLADLLQAVRSEFEIKYWSEAATKQLLRAVWYAIETFCEPPTYEIKDPSERDQQAVDEIIGLLEPSIWKIFGHNDTGPDHGTAKTLWEAIESLLAPRNNNGGWYADNDKDIPPASEVDQITEEALFESMLRDSPELVEALFPEAMSGGGLGDDTDVRELHFELDDNLTMVVGFRQVSQEEADEEDESTTTLYDDPNLIYCRHHLPTKIPDIVDQIEEHSGKPLKYSKSMERALRLQAEDREDYDY